MAALPSHLPDAAVAPTLERPLANFDDNMLAVLNRPVTNGEEFLAFELAAEALGREISDRPSGGRRTGGAPSRFPGGSRVSSP